MIKTFDCEDIVERTEPYLERKLSRHEVEAVEAHLRECSSCRDTARCFRAVHGLLEYVQLEPNMSPTASAALSRIEDEEAEQTAVAAAPTWYENLGGAPWWGVSLALHVLVIALAGLVTMAIELPKTDESVVMVTELVPRKEVKVEEEKKPEEQANRNALEPKPETPPTDKSSTEVSDIVVPPEILAKAELGDHFETINLDRPDTQSAFGNPDARMFHSVTGNDEPEGGGGMGGVGGLDDLIGVGGHASPGTGGGWGGGNGTGIGVGNGAGKGSFGSRNGGGRRLMVKRHGGNKATENAVDKALEWLARHQEADGHWNGAKYGASMAGDTALTGLATLAFLGAGHTEKVGKYKDNVQRGVKWLIAQQNAQGRIMKPGDGCNAGYNHSIGALALAEAVGMARIPETREAAQKAVAYSIEIHQLGKGSDKLGWRYDPQDIGDISVSGWFIMQLKSAKVAGLQVDPLALEGAHRYLDTVMVEKPNPNDPYSGHKYGYRTDGQGGGIRVKSSHCNTAIGCLGRQFLGTPIESLHGGVEYFVTKGGVPNAKAPEFYFWYYGTLSTFQQGGDIWKKWNEGIKTALPAMQRVGGDEDGSWDPVGHPAGGGEAWEPCGGRVFTTAIGAMCLEIYYRYQKLN